MMCEDNRIHYDTMVVSVFMLHTTSLSSICRRIWRHWSSKMLVMYILSSVCLRLCKFSQLSFRQYMGLFVFSLPISLVMIVGIYVLCRIVIIKSEVWPICHCLGLDHETVLCVVCPSTFRGQCWGFVVFCDYSVGLSCPGGFCLMN